MNKQQILDKHYKLSDLAINHGYLPDGSHASVHELGELHKFLGMGKVDMYCGGCVFKMFTRLYNGYIPPPTTPPQSETVKVTMPKHKKK